ncbi:hypothetical protein D3C85_1894150 [compost metagenome]
MGKTRNWTGPAIADVGCCSSDRACRSKPTEQGSDQVSDALADQLLIGVMLGTRHAVGDNSRQ